MTTQIPPTFYKDIIKGDIITDKIQNALRFRYELLQTIEQLKSSPNHYQDKLNETIQRIFTTRKSTIDITWSSDESILYDISSHLLLCLMYCDFDSEIQWFCKQEALLFQTRVLIGKYSIFHTLQALGIPLTPFKTKDLTVEDKQIIKHVHFKQKPKTPNEPIYFVPFENALSLLASHKYFLHNGNIFFLESEIFQLIQSIFIDIVKTNLLKIKANKEHLLSDPRIRTAIRKFEHEREELALHKETTLDIKANEYRLSLASDVDKVAHDAFPLCMYAIHKHINDNSHLMHFGRLQYTLFLKGTGLPLEESLRYFQKKYERKTPADKFEKNYAYNIRHSYGMEGKRSDYAPYSCVKINNMNAPGGQECHGCPFKTFTEERLKSVLFGMKLNEISVMEILEKKRNNEFMVCCKRYFEGKFPNSDYEGVGIHPNRYFVSAMKAMEKRMGNKKVKIEYESAQKNS